MVVYLSQTPAQLFTPISSSGSSFEEAFFGWLNDFRETTPARTGGYYAAQSRSEMAGGATHCRNRSTTDEEARSYLTTMSSIAAVGNTGAAVKPASNRTESIGEEEAHAGFGGCGMFDPASPQSPMA